MEVVPANGKNSKMSVLNHLSTHSVAGTQGRQPPHEDHPGIPADAALQAPAHHRQPRGRYESQSPKRSGFRGPTRRPPPRGWE